VAIIDALNRAYDVAEWRPWWKRRLVAIGLTIALALSKGGRAGQRLRRSVPSVPSAILRIVPPPNKTARRRRRRGPAEPRSATARLQAAERLFEDFKALTPFRCHRLVRSFDSFDEYERWRHAQTNPWYR
jgi:hypothetical protein